MDLSLEWAMFDDSSEYQGSDTTVSGEGSTCPGLMEQQNCRCALMDSINM